MAQYAILQNNICVNVIVCDSDQADSGWVLLTDANSEYATIGAQYDSSTNTFQQISLDKEFELGGKTAEEVARQELLDTDWTQLPDVGLTADNVIEWRSYRAKLRQLKDGVLGLSDWPDAPDKEYV